MSSTSSTTSPNDAGSTSTEATGEDATRPFPAAGDTQPLTPPVTQLATDPAAEPETQPVTMPLPASQEAGAETADVTGEGVGGIDYVIENAEGSQHLGDIAEADTGTSGLDPPQSIPSDAGAFGDLLRGQTEDHAPTMDVRPEVLHLTIDSVSGHVHPPYGDHSSQ